MTQSENIINIDLPLVSQLKRIKTERIKTERIKKNLKFYLKLNSYFTENISQMILKLDFDENKTDNKITYLYEILTNNETNDKIIKLNDKIFIEET